MSLNWREIELILSELPLEGSMIQKSYQIGFNGLLLELFHPQERSWLLYVEVGTPSSRLHRLSETVKDKKTPKLQRFIQFMRAHIEGARIVGFAQLKEDRLVTLNLSKRESAFKLILRFYSGPKANVIITDENYQILELLFRRPRQNEITGETLIIEERPPLKPFEVRPYPADIPFNQFIEEYYKRGEPEERQELITKLEQMRDTELATLSNRIRKIIERLKQSKDFDAYRHSGDLLSSYPNPLERDQEWVEVEDWLQESSKVTISVDPNLSLGENIEKSTTLNF